MSFFAEVNDNNIVERVVVVEEGRDAAWCNNFFGGTWVETSEDGSTRKNYAGAGHTYDSVNDVFYEPKPYASWSLDAETYQWTPPVAHPNNGISVSWSEEQQAWLAD
jgi:hypothetical protein